MSDVIESVDARKRIVAALFAGLQGCVAGGGEPADVGLDAGHAVGKDAQHVVRRAAGIGRFQVLEGQVGAVCAAEPAAGADRNSARHGLLLAQQHMGTGIGGGNSGHGAGESVTDNDDVERFAERRRRIRRSDVIHGFRLLLRYGPRAHCGDFCAEPDAPLPSSRRRVRRMKRSERQTVRPVRIQVPFLAIGV